LLAAAGGAVLLGTFCLQPLYTPSTSMEDTLLLGEYLLVDKLSYGPRVPFTDLRLPVLARPGQGDVVVFESPPDPVRLFAKRCMATAGQTVEIRDKAVYVDGERLPDPPLSKYMDAAILPAGRNPRDNLGPQRVPENCLFVMGDNRDNSRDSRHWGVLPLERVVGKVLCVYWSCAPGDAGLPAGPGPSGWLAEVRSLPERVRWQRLGTAAQ
jgi:signal peptidase I